MHQTPPCGANRSCLPSVEDLYSHLPQCLLKRPAGRVCRLETQKKRFKKLAGEMHSLIQNWLNQNSDSGPTVLHMLSTEDTRDMLSMRSLVAVRIGPQKLGQEPLFY